MDSEKLNQNPDNLGQGKTIYTAGFSEIFWKNFVAGLARGLGMFVFSLLLWLVIGGLFVSYAWPMLQPMMRSLETLTNSVEQMQDLNSNFSNGLPALFGVTR